MCSPSTIDAMAYKHTFETVFKQDMPSFSMYTHRPNVVANLSPTINVDLLHTIIKRVETLEIYVPALEVEVKS
jgi:hypothetical protein